LGSGSKGQGEVMSDAAAAASALRAAAFHLWGPINRAEAEEGIKCVEAAIAALPPDLAAQVERAILRDTDERTKTLEALADELESESAKFADLPESKMDNLPPDPRPKRRRKPTLAQALRQAADAKVPVKSAVIGADGVTLHFGKSEQAMDLNDWDEVLPREPH
jgi:hypothetical protein